MRPLLLEAATRAWTRKLPILTHFSNLAPEGDRPAVASGISCVCTVRTRHVVGRGYSVAQNAQMDLRREAEVSERRRFSARSFVVVAYIHAWIHYTAHSPLPPSLR